MPNPKPSLLVFKYQGAWGELKEVSRSNIPEKKITLDTFHLLSGWPKDVARPNIRPMLPFVFNVHRSASSQQQPDASGGTEASHPVGACPDRGHAQ